MAWKEREMTADEMGKEATLTFQSMGPPTIEEVQAEGKKLKEVLGEAFDDDPGLWAEKVYAWHKYRSFQKHMSHGRNNSPAL